MSEDSIWQRELAIALHLENLFMSEGLGLPLEEVGDHLKPTRAESERAVANIREWRSYLPAPCVAKMIDDGWQWST